MDVVHKREAGESRTVSDRVKIGQNRGETFVEFALVVPLLFLLIFAIIDFGYVFYIKVTLENAVRQAGRYAVTGNRLTDTNGVLETRIQSIKDVAKKQAMGWPVIVNVNTMQAGTNFFGAPGGPGDFVTVSIAYTNTFFTRFVGRYFPGGKYGFIVTTTFRNERF